MRIPRPVLTTWLMLTAATFVSWWLSTRETSGGDIVAVVILAIAAFKMWLVGMYFMELRYAPRLLRATFEFYVVALFAGLAGFFLTS